MPAVGLGVVGPNMVVYAPTAVFARVVPQTVQLSNDKGSILVCLMPNSQEDAILGI